MAWHPAPLDRDADAPLHQQLAGQIREQIRTGRLGEGDLLPPEPQLAQMLGVARGTVTRAIQDLVREGALSRRRRRGTTVLPVGGQPAPAGGQSTAAVRHMDEPGLDERMEQIQQELLARLARMEALQEQVMGELFLLRRQRQWSRALRQRGARRRATAADLEAGRQHPAQRRRRLS
jgi:GntR family transcriptional regulator